MAGPHKVSRRKWAVAVLAVIISALLVAGIVLVLEQRADRSSKTFRSPKRTLQKPRPDSARPSAGPKRKIVMRGLSPRSPRAPSLDEQLAQMDWGNIAFNTPRTIPLRKPRKIHLVIHPSLSAEDLTERIKKAGPVETDRIKISNIMQAKLIGSSFTITPITPETQPVSKTHATEWKWEVAPQKPGIQSLYLTINAMVTVGQNERPRPIKTFDREIQVQVTGMQQATLFLIKNWVWVVAGLLVTAAATFFFTRTLRRRSLTSRVARAPLSAADEPVDIFISYSSKDRNEVLPMVERLRQEGLKVWIDQGGIDGALLWGQEIVDAITRCRVVLVMGSSSSFSSPNVVKEICLASEQQKPILPVHLEPVEVPKSISYPLAGIQHIEIFRGDREQNMGAILRSLHRLGVRGDSQEGEDVQNGDAS